MERDIFIDKFKKAVPLKAEDISEILKKSINSTRKTNKDGIHLVIVMEEFSELIKEISKALRGKGDTVCLLEECADVQIGLYYIQEIFNISDYDLRKAVAVKINRLNERLKKKETF